MAINNNGISDALFDRVTRIGLFENQSPEWHEARAQGIGGSDVGAIIGVNKYQSFFSLWAKKLGKIDDPAVTSEAAEWGTRLESAVIQKFADEHPELEVISNVGTWRNNERPWQIANPDALFFDGKDYGILEIKTARYEDDWTDGIPLSYQAQVQWYLHTFGLNKAYVAVLFSGSKYQEFTLDANSFEHEINLKAVENFRDHVDQDRMPDFDGATATYEAIRQIHPEIDPDGEVDLGDLYEHYINAQADFDQAQAKINELKSRVLGAMGNAKKGLYEDSWVLSRQARGSGHPFLVNKKQ
jgi:putative phage-type endonuclease